MSTEQRSAEPEIHTPAQAMGRFIPRKFEIVALNMFDCWL